MPSTHWALLCLLLLCIGSGRSTASLAGQTDDGPPGASGAAAGMTSRFFHDFFPALARFVLAHAPAAWHLVQPAHIAQRCPEADALLPWPWPLRNHASAGSSSSGAGAGGRGGLRVRNPHLMPYQLLGAAVGLGGARRLLGQRCPATVYWGASFLFFGLMNLSSIAAHALLARQSRPWEWACVVDIAFTASASACMLYQQASRWAALPEGVRGVLLPARLHPPATLAGARSICFKTVLAALAAGFGGHWLSIAWGNELLYIGTTLVAADAVALVSWSARRTATPRQRAFYRAGVAGMLMALAALPLDPLLCRAFGTAFGTVHLLFLGCDLAYWGLYGFATGHALGLPHSLPAAGAASKQD